MNILQGVQDAVADYITVFYVQEEYTEAVTESLFLCSPAAYNVNIQTALAIGSMANSVL